MTHKISDMTNSPNDTLQLITVSQTAELLAVCPRTIRRLIKNKTLEAVRIAGAVRIRRSEIELYIANTP